VRIKPNTEYLSSSLRVHRSGATLIEVLLYMVLTAGLLSLLVFFLTNTFSYYAYITDKVKLSETADLLVRHLKRDLDKTVLSRVSIGPGAEAGSLRAVLEVAEAVEPDGTLKWGAEPVCYEFLPSESMVFRWIGGQDRLASKRASGEFRSWPYVEKFSLEKVSPRNLQFEVSMLFKDAKERTHRYQTAGSVDVMGGHSVR
jgi:type II secretory pathway component PulJ